MAGWIGVDLDGTLAHYDGWKGADHIGEPVPAMLFRVRKWIADGREVRIFTARVWAPELPSADDPEREAKMARRGESAMAARAIRAWCRLHQLGELQITCVKDYGMVELWDDRAVAVQQNTGEFLAWEKRA